MAESDSKEIKPTLGIEHLGTAIEDKALNSVKSDFNKFQAGMEKADEELIRALKKHGITTDDVHFGAQFVETPEMKQIESKLTKITNAAKLDLRLALDKLGVDVDTNLAQDFIDKAVEKLQTKAAKDAVIADAHNEVDAVLVTMPNVPDARSPGQKANAKVPIPK